MEAHALVRALARPRTRLALTLGGPFLTFLLLMGLMLLGFALARFLPLPGNAYFVAVVVLASLPTLGTFLLAPTLMSPHRAAPLRR